LSPFTVYDIPLAHLSSISAHSGSCTFSNRALNIGKLPLKANNKDFSLLASRLKFSREETKIPDYDYDNDKSGKP